MNNVNDWEKQLKLQFDFIMQFWHSPKPTIAAVHGYCLAGAFELALACDITVAAKTTKFGEPEVRFGTGIVAMLLPWITGPKQAKEILEYMGDWCIRIKFTSYRNRLRNEKDIKLTKDRYEVINK